MSAAKQLNHKVIEGTRERLKAWGEWLQALEGVGVDSSTVGRYEELLDKGRGPDDPDSERMDRILGRVKMQQPVYFKVLKMIYYLEMPNKVIADEVKVSEATVKIYRGYGEASVAAYWDAGEGVTK